MWVGIDDTDSPLGGCTTHVLTELLRVARGRGVDVLGEPRLVRLNPNVPWKTRGNAALSVRLGLGRGRRTRIGVIDGRPVWGYPRGRPVPDGDRAPLVDALWTAVLSGSRREAGTDPAMVVGDRTLPSGLYERAVRTIVRLRDAESALREAGYEVRVRGSRRGLIGATAAVAWPGRRATWELIAYRRPGQGAGARYVSADSVRAAQQEFPQLFLCYDERTRRLLVAPHTPCPILFGLRSRDGSVLARAARRVRSEPVDRWVRFRTNQGTGDHVREPVDAGLPPFTSGRLTGTVAAPPLDLRGGHVRLELLDRQGARVTCLAFEPSKTLPNVVRSLSVGETAEVWGGRAEDTAFRIEGLVLRDRRPLRVRGPRPRCPACGRATRSLGRGRGFRCPRCRARLPPEARSTRLVAPRFGPGTYHPTPSARRHLAPIGPEARR
jgi:tRNA(Ile2)-agmatinylcytidine synthase